MVVEINCGTVCGLNAKERQAFVTTAVFMCFSGVKFDLIKTKSGFICNIDALSGLTGFLLLFVYKKNVVY